MSRAAYIALQNFAYWCVCTFRVTLRQAYPQTCLGPWKYTDPLLSKLSTRSRALLEGEDPGTCQNQQYPHLIQLVHLFAPPAHER